MSTADIAGSGLLPMLRVALRRHGTAFALLLVRAAERQGEAVVAEAVGCSEEALSEFIAEATSIAQSQAQGKGRRKEGLATSIPYE